MLFYKVAELRYVYLGLLRARFDYNKGIIEVGKGARETKIA